ncbi:hypothetical protein Tco_0768616 [Tanacetum coccineum]
MTMTTTVTSMADPTTTTKEIFVEPSIFGGGSSSMAEHTIGGFSGLTGSDFIVGGIRTVVSPDTDLQKVYIPQWSVTNGSRLDDGSTCPQWELCLCGEKDSLLKARDEEIKSLKAQLLVKEAEAAEAIHLCAEASKFEVVEKSLQDEIKSLKERNTALEKEKGVSDVRVADLAATVKVREQEAADSDAMVTTVKLQNDRLADQMCELETSSAGLRKKLRCMRIELAVVMCPITLSLVACCPWVSYPAWAIEKGMQDGLAAGITHGQEGRVLTDVDTFNPSAKDDFTFALQEVQNVNFSLLAELQSNKDSSVEAVMVSCSSFRRIKLRIGARSLSLFTRCFPWPVQRIKKTLLLTDQLF